MTSKRLEWRVSSFTNGTTCVAVAGDGDHVHVRNSNHPDDGTLSLTREQMAGLVAGVKAGDWDDLT